MSKKKIIILMLLVSASLLLTGCISRNDSKKFKEEYEKLNNTKNENNNKMFRTVKISENNPIVYQTADEIVSRMDKKETFIVYFGFNSCPWCRSIIETLLEVADDLDIGTIYYVDVLDIRDTLKVNDDSKISVEKKGTDGYYSLLKKFDNILSDYTLYDSNNNAIKANEKRIYAPNIIYVEDGKAEKLTEGISDYQTDAYMELTDEMIEDSYDKIENVLEELDD